MRLTPHRLKVCSPADLRPGDHIAVRRGEGYTHHGIYLGEGLVAHFTDEAGLAAKHAAQVRETTLETFLRGGLLLRRRHRHGLPRQEVVARARAVIYGERPWRRYHLIRNNCEHFAHDCATRRPRSLQVRKVMGVAAVGGLWIGRQIIKRQTGWRV